MLSLKDLKYVYTSCAVLIAGRLVLLALTTLTKFLFMTFKDLKTASLLSAVEPSDACQLACLPTPDNNLRC